MTLAGLWWLGALIALVVFDLVRSAQRKPTLSQWVWAQDRRYPWFRWVVLAGFAALMLHFFLR